MNERQTELLIEALRDINISLQKIDRSLDQMKEEVRDNN